MRFVPAGLDGAFLVEPEPARDPRGFFARSWCADEFAAHGLNPRLAQCSMSHSLRRGTLRGLHFQAAPHREAKLVRCTHGAVHDVIVDLRAGSPTRLAWRAFELTRENRLALYVPEGFAHGFQTLEDDTEVLYQISQPFRPELARGLRWDDPALAVRWPVPDPILSERDRTHPLLAVRRPAGL